MVKRTNRRYWRLLYDTAFTWVSMLGNESDVGPVTGGFLPPNNHARNDGDSPVSPVRTRLGAWYDTYGAISRTRRS